MTSPNIVEDREAKERIDVEALGESLNALEIVNEVYGLNDIEFVQEAIAKIKQALNTFTKEDWDEN